MFVGEPLSKNVPTGSFLMPRPKTRSQVYRLIVLSSLMEADSKRLVVSGGSGQ